MTTPTPDPAPRNATPFTWTEPPGVRRAYRGGVAQILGGPDLIPTSDQLVFTHAPTQQHPERTQVSVKPDRAGRYLKRGQPNTPVCVINHSYSHHQRAFREGWDAARAGYLRIHCPYSRRTEYGKHWLRGWHAAADAATTAAETTTTEPTASGRAPTILEDPMTLTHDNENAPLSAPQAYTIDQKPESVAINLTGADGQDTATVLVEIDAESQQPVVRIFDAVNGIDNDPRTKLALKPETD